jgi:hypothetical protein
LIGIKRAISAINRTYIAALTEKSIEKGKNKYQILLTKEKLNE